MSSEHQIIKYAHVVSLPHELRDYLIVSEMQQNVKNSGQTKKLEVEEIQPIPVVDKRKHQENLDDRPGHDWVAHNVVGWVA